VTSPCNRCNASATKACNCPRCRRETVDERYYTCATHEAALTSDHERVRGRGAEWQPTPGA